jgi:hypothetical protein
MKKLFTLLVLFLLPLFAVEEENTHGSKSIFLSYQELPSKIYVGQLLPIKIQAIITHTKFDTISMQFGKSTSSEIINPNTKWQSLGNNTYETTCYFKIKATSLQLPSLHVNLLSKNQPIEKETLEIAPLQAISLKKEPLFSNVIAQTLSINKYKTTSFDAKNAIIVLEIEANQANLKDFNLSQIPKNGIDSFSENGTTQKIYYYAIVPNYQKTFEFTYFDLPSNKFHKISLPIVIESEEVSTQLGLNPKESIFEFYKSVGYGIGAILFFLLFIRKRKLIFFLGMTLFATLFFVDQNPLNNVELKQNSSLMILPTERSTLFFTSNQALHVEKLAQRGDYVKVLLPDGKIGWTKHENIIKH